MIQTRQPGKRESAALDRLFKAISAVRRHARLRYGTGTPVSSSLSCPACKRGRVAYTVHQGGRIDGRCTAIGCVAWTGQ